MEYVKTIFGRVGGSIFEGSSIIFNRISYSLLANLLIVIGIVWWVVPTYLIYRQGKSKIKTEKTKRLKRKYE